MTIASSETDERNESAPSGAPTSVNTLWERMSFGLAHWSMSALLASLGINGLYRFGTWLGSVEYLINYKRRRRFRRAYARILGRRPTRAERRRATRQFFVHSRCNKLFYLVLDCIPRESANQLFTIENEQLLDEAVARGCGVYMALCHHGPQHIAGMLMAMRGHKAAGVRDRNEGGLRRYVQGRFDTVYPEFRRLRVLFSDSYPRDIFRCFQEGHVLGSAMDIKRARSSTQKLEELTIFGEKRPFLTGPMHAAIRCKAPILQGFFTSEDGFRYTLRIVERLIDPNKVKDTDEAVTTAMKRYVANIEQHVSHTPWLLTRI